MLSKDIAEQAKLRLTKYNKVDLLSILSQRSELNKGPEPFRQPGIAQSHAVIPHRHFQCTRLSHQHAEAPGACDSRIEKIALEEQGVLTDERHHNRQILAPLAFMHGNGVC